MTRWLLRVLLLGLLALPASVSAQPPWVVSLVWISGEGLVFTQVTPFGASDVPLLLPPGGGTENTILYEADVSPDFTRLAVIYLVLETDQSSALALYDLTTGAVIRVDNPAGMSGGDMVIGGFSPDARRIALSYVGFDYSLENPFVGGLALIDAATGAVNAMLPTEVFNPYFSYEGVWMLMGDWSGRGVELAPNCYACEPPFAWQYFVWNPDAPAVELIPGADASVFGDVLDGSGEMLYLTQDASYPADPDMGMFPTPNVVQYFADGRLPDFGATFGAPVVYFNPDDIMLEGDVRWIADGHAFVVAQREPDEFTSQTWYLVERAGRRSTLLFPPGTRFLAGTPDGWLSAVPANLSAAPDTYEIISYTLQPTGDVLAAPMGITRGVPVVADKPLMGFRVTTGFVTETPPDPSTYAAILGANMPQCEGFLPSRLIPGGMGRVTPGDPNRLRSAPSRDATILTNIPGGAAFVVLSGPACDGGIAWWEVSYEGLTGWTAEGLGDTYFLEPVATEGAG